MYNKEFGSESRKVIAHMPHFIDKDIMQSLIVCTVLHAYLVLL